MRNELFGCVLSVAVLANACWGDETVYLKQDSSLCDTYRAFRITGEGCTDNQALPTGNGSLGASRSIRLREHTELAPVSRPVSVSIPVLFGFDSYVLSPESKAQLDKIAKVISSPDLASKVILLEGHADASGPAQYNLRLSKKRALAVKRYLVDKYGLSASRFPVDGKGESDLYDPLNPLADINRRVEFVVE